MAEEEQKDVNQNRVEVEEQVPVQTPVQTPTKVSFPSTPRQKRATNKKILIISGAIFVLGLGGWFIFRKPKATPTPSPSPIPVTQGITTVSTPTPAPVDKSEIKIEILNGTGIPKEATYLQGQLADLGYEEIEISNAETQDFTVTQVTFSADLASEVVDEITERLEDLYKQVKTKTSSSLAKDIQVITGLRKGSTPRPSPSPTPAESPSPTPTPTPTTSPAPTPTP